MCDDCRYEDACFRLSELWRQMFFRGTFDLAGIKEQTKDCQHFIGKPEKHWVE